MKLIHTADWHLGKNIEGHSRLEEQRLFLKDFINICEEEQADIIIIAGIFMIIIILPPWQNSFFTIL